MIQRGLRWQKIKLEMINFLIAIKKKTMMKRIM
mgnify:CR=1 FL=1